MKILAVKSVLQESVSSLCDVQKTFLLLHTRTAANSQVNLKWRAGRVLEDGVSCPSWSGVYKRWCVSRMDMP